jgi:hypothetical protein
MEKPDALTVAWYQAAIPDDPRARRGQMFGHPCAFVGDHMFFGTFGQSVIVRLGTARVAEEAKGGCTVFLPMAGRPWKEYLQVPRGAIPAPQLTSLVKEALETTSLLPPKPEKPPKSKGKGSAKA